MREFIYYFMYDRMYNNNIGISNMWIKPTKMKKYPHDPYSINHKLQSLYY